VGIVLVEEREAEEGIVEGDHRHEGISREASHCTTLDSSINIKRGGSLFGGEQGGRWPKKEEVDQDLRLRNP